MIDRTRQSKKHTEATREQVQRDIKIGMVLAVDAVDWGLVNEQVPSDSPALTIVRGRIYGEVIICNEEWITLAPQVFEDGDVRNAISLPWATVERVEILLEPSP